MKKFFLLCMIIGLSIGTSWAYDKDDLQSYVNYAFRLASANKDLGASEALYYAATEAETKVGTADEAATLTTLKEAVNKFIADGVTEGAIYVEYNDGASMGALTSWTDAGWELGASGMGAGSNDWNTKKNNDYGGYGLEKWISSASESNYAKQTLYDLPVGSYTLNIKAAADANIAEAYYILNGGEAVTMAINNGSAEVKQFTFYANEAITSLEYGVRDYEGKYGWVIFGNVHVIYAGADQLAPNKANFNEAFAAAQTAATTITNVPAGVLTQLQNVIAQYDGATYTTADEYDAATAALQAAVEEANQCQITFNDYVSTRAQVEELLESVSESDAKDALQAVLTEQNNIVSAASDSGTLLRALNTLEEAYRTYQYAVADEENPVVLFDSGEIYSLNGWLVERSAASNTGGSTWYVSKRTSAPAGNYLEMWGSAASNYAYREITNVPEGLYNLSIFIANSATCQLTFGEETFDIEKNESGTTVSKDFYLEEAADALRFGIYSADGSWVLFNKLKLVYKGQDAVRAMRNQFLDELNTARTYAESLESTLPESVFNTFTDYLMEQEDAADGFDSVEAFQAAFEELSQKQTELAACNEASQTYHATAEKATALAEEAQNADFDAIIAAAQTAFAQATSVADIEACTAALNDALYTYGMQFASFDRPFEIYASGEITSLEGWVTDGTSESNNGNNNWYLSNRSSEPTGHVMEMWGSNKSNHAYREFANLPAGAYRVSVLAGSSEPISLYFNGTVATQQEANSNGQTFTATFVLVAEQESTYIGVEAPPTWVAFNNLKVEYCGNVGTFEIAKHQLEEAIAKAQSVVDAGEGVGDGLFCIAPSAVEAYQQAINKATTDLEAAETTEDLDLIQYDLATAQTTYEQSVNLPAETDVYVISQVASNLYLNFNAETGAVTVSATPSGVNFVSENEGLFFIKGNDYALGYEGSNSWTMSALADNRAEWAISLTATGYVLKGKNGYLASDDIAEGSPVYGNKAIDHEYGQWKIELAPEDISVAILGIADNAARTSAIYNVAGQRVSAPAKGLYIMNGKKYLVQ